ncbi:MAG: hypothetical protein A2008_13510 [Candidatus Wallbacteria bacterium GWC2_49_35]|uniref:Uncharacterized protein n=1 Tax=Candidatus Wallbacteria bacterium GWC2_49_35 TaxID=1817813 RepID=A0A1F7WXI7_9BACT|nr:MAG: hypothetical protein A2008_13510 [Candidatus Wallbacteria bacterium GWC2_49_35]HBC75184.1 hypothetical protein [Candidatus Wallbacteria bacterium]
MQDKTIKFFTISFIPAFLVNELNQKDFVCRDLFDYLIERDSCYQMENKGEQFLQCANINPMVKILAGFLSCENAMPKAVKSSFNYLYSPKFASRDILACLENFMDEAVSPSFRKIDYVLPSRAGNARHSHLKEDEIDPIKGYDCLVSAYKKNSGAASAGFNSIEKCVILIGSTPPLFKDLIDYLSSWNVRIIYFEYLDILKKSNDKIIFTPDIFLNITWRLNNILELAKKLCNEGRSLKFGIIHTFPKFSHYEMEDHFFKKNIAEKYLSLEYAGGGKLSERDKIRLESFLKIIN